MPRRVGIHDCDVRYHQSSGLYTLTAMIYGGGDNATSEYNLPTPIRVDLILDTGAAFLSVKRSLFNVIEPRDIRPQYIAGISGTTSSRRGLVDIVVDGRLRVNNVDIVELDELPYQRISGLLGMGFLRHFGVYFAPRILRSLLPGGAEIPMLRFHYYNSENYEQD